MPTLSAADTERLWDHFLRAREDPTRTALIERYAALVPAAIAAMLPRLGCKIDPEDAEGAGLLALVQAVDAFDPTRGDGRFEPFAIQRIRRAVSDLIRRESFRPRSVVALSRRLGRAGGSDPARFSVPQMEELAQTLAIELDQVYEIRLLVLRGALLSLEEAGPLPSADPGPEEQARVNIIRERVLAGVQELPEPEQGVVIAYWWRGETFRAIGAGMQRSKDTAIIIKTRALRLLAEWLAEDAEFIAAAGGE